MIGNIQSDTDAERFSDYLVTRQIGNMVEESAAGDWAVWIEDDDQLDRAKSELHEFLRNPADSKYGTAAREAESLRREQDKQQKKKRTRYVDVRTRWGQPRQWAAPLTLTLIALSCVISVGTNSLHFGGEPRSTVDLFRFASINEQRWVAFADGRGSEINNEHEFFVRYWLHEMRRGEAWRLFTPMFLHWNIFHLLFNMFWLRDLGAMVEVQRGTWRLALLVLLCSLVPFMCQNAVSGPGFGGMSGVVYGLFGYVWVKGRYEPWLGLGISHQGAMMMMAWLLICMTGLIGPVANTAHVVGLVIGAMTAYAPVGRKKLQKKVEASK